MVKTDVRIQIRDFILDTGTAIIMGTSPIGKFANDTLTNFPSPGLLRNLDSESLNCFLVGHHISPWKRLIVKIWNNFGL